MAGRRARSGRLTRSADFDRVYRNGRSVGSRELAVYVFPSETADRPRLGVSVSRKVGGAVERNRVKRVIREAFARCEPRLREGHDVVVVARPDVLAMARDGGTDAVEHSLGELLRRAGVAEGGVATEGATVRDGDGSPAGTTGVGTEEPQQERQP